MPLTLDYSYMLGPPVRNGVDAAELERTQRLFSEALASIVRKRVAGELGFLDLPDDKVALGACAAVAAEYSDELDDVVVMGIGGSALGTTALRTALLPPLWNVRDSHERGGRPRLHVLDNVDPRSVAALLAFVKVDRTLFVVASKSGSTAETMAQYLIVRKLLHDTLGDRARDRIVFLTDPERGALRRLARSEGIRALDVPPNVGGRFSVLSSVGLFPALLTGIDADALLRGAAAMRERCMNPELVNNPAGMYATLQWLADARRGAHIHVFMPYCDALRDFAHWFVQLWAESLGKITPSQAHTGPTPVPAVGATDQHSQVQLFMEGPLDKTVTFLAAGRHLGQSGNSGDSGDVRIPSDATAGTDLAYLAGRTLGALLDAERRATAGALAARGRPSMTIEMPAVDAYHVGELVMLLEFATIVAGELYGVDALDQPGVELGKQFTYALMGRAGSEASLAEWQSLPQPDAHRRV